MLLNRASNRKIGSDPDLSWFFFSGSDPDFPVGSYSDDVRESSRAQPSSTSRCSVSTSHSPRSW